MGDNRFRQLCSLLLQQSLKCLHLSSQERLLPQQAAPGLGGAADDKFLMFEHHLQVVRSRVEQIPRRQPRKMLSHIFRIICGRVEISFDLVQVCLPNLRVCDLS